MYFVYGKNGRDLIIQLFKETKSWSGDTPGYYTSNKDLGSRH